jgi:hypothetical protein
MDPWIILKKINKKTFVLGFFMVVIPMFLTLTCSLVIVKVQESRFFICVCLTNWLR